MIVGIRVQTVLSAGRGRPFALFGCPGLPYLLRFWQPPYGRVGAARLVRVDPDGSLVGYAWIPASLVHLVFQNPAYDLLPYPLPEPQEFTL